MSSCYWPIFCLAVTMSASEKFFRPNTKPGQHGLITVARITLFLFIATLKYVIDFMSFKFGKETGIVLLITTAVISIFKSIKKIDNK